MRHLVNPSRRQKGYISKNGLDFTQYYASSESTTTMEIVHKVTGESKIILKNPRKVKNG